MFSVVLDSWAFVASLVDASWVDITALLGGVAHAAHRRSVSGSRQPWISKATGLDVANGVSLVPLGLLVAGGLSTHILTELVHSNRLILAVAGIVALCAILEVAPKDRVGDD